MWTIFYLFVTWQIVNITLALILQNILPIYKFMSKMIKLINTFTI